MGLKGFLRNQNQHNGDAAEGSVDTFLSPSPMAEQMFDVPVWGSEPVIKVPREDRAGSDVFGGPMLGIVMKVPKNFLTKVKNFVDNKMELPYESLHTIMFIEAEDEDDADIAIPITITEFNLPSAKPIWTYYNIADMDEYGALNDLKSAITEDALVIFSFVDDRLRELAVESPDGLPLKDMLAEVVSLYEEEPWGAEEAHEIIQELMEMRVERGIHTIKDFVDFMQEMGGGDGGGDGGENGI